MKNVLILCDSFPPAFAPRMGYLCKYLAHFGWHPIVVTEYLPQSIYENLATGQDVTYINFYFSNNRFWQKIKYTFVFLADFLFGYKNFILIKKANKIIAKKKIHAVLSSSYRIFPAQAACTISRQHHVPFVMDLRDIIEQYPDNEHISKKIIWFSSANRRLIAIVTQNLLRQRNRLLQNANAVTTVSDFHKEILSQYNHNVKLIYNGFDPELFFAQIIENKCFMISYTGRIESQKIKDPSLFFEAIFNLLSEKKIDMAKLDIRFYLTDEESKTIIRKLAEDYQVIDCINILDSVQSTEIPRILHESSILLLLTNKITGENTPRGIMGTKMFEYLAVERPVLCVRSDEDCMEKTINAAHAGLAASTVKEIEKFILEKFSQWQQSGYIHQPINREFVRQFSRKRQAEQFAGLLNGLTEKM